MVELSVIPQSESAEQKILIPHGDGFGGLGRGLRLQLAHQRGVELNHIKALRACDEVQLGKYQFGAVLLQWDQHVDAGMFVQTAVRLDIKALLAQQRFERIHDLFGSFHKSGPFGMRVVLL